MQVVKGEWIGYLEDGRTTGSLVTISGPMPEEYPDDALHITICAVNGMDYTWSPGIVRIWPMLRSADRLSAFWRKPAISNPAICTPEELMEV